MLVDMSSIKHQLLSLTQTVMLAEHNTASIVDISTGQRLFQASPMDRVWVELSASGSATHGPTLRIRLVSEQHPAVQAAKAAMQAASEADYAQRAQRAEGTVQMPIKREMHPSQKAGQLHERSSGKGAQDMQVSGSLVNRASTVRMDHGSQHSHFPACALRKEQEKAKSMPLGVITGVSVS